MPEEVMHPSMARLYEAAKTLRQKEGQSEVARLLNYSPQRLNNWERRGISREGAVEAEKTIGCSANWLLDGTGAMASGWPFESIDQAKLTKLDPGTLKKLEEALLFTAEKQLEIDIQKKASPGKSERSRRKTG
jgi:transcriptional regulator with XRE-family HTH domain